MMARYPDTVLLMSFSGQTETQSAQKISALTQNMQVRQGTKQALQALIFHKQQIILKMLLPGKAFWKKGKIVHYPCGKAVNSAVVKKGDKSLGPAYPKRFTDDFILNIRLMFMQGKTDYGRVKSIISEAHGCQILLMVVNIFSSSSSGHFKHGWRPVHAGGLDSMSAQKLALSASAAPEIHCVGNLL
jgi:hypothetical protein